MDGNRLRLTKIISGFMVMALLSGCQDSAAGREEEASVRAADSGETVIEGNGTEVNITGSGAVFDGKVITISQEGNYRLKGTIDEGRIEICAGKKAAVCLIMDGVSVASSEYAAIYENGCKNLTIRLEEGTENAVYDNRIYDENHTSDDPDAPIFCTSDLILEGEGSLAVYGNYQEGIRGKDNLTIKSGTYSVEALNDGIKGKDSVQIEGGNITVQAGGDGIQVDNDSDETKGYAAILGGDIRITAEEKGIKAETLVDIAGGVLDIVSKDDAIHSDGDVSISGGSLSVSTEDDGIHGENQVSLSGGSLNIVKSYEGIEGLSITISEGAEIAVNAEDDGINAAGGRDASGNTGPFERNPFSVTEGAYIRIAGGTVNISVGGDGIDSNGDFFMEGGTVYVETTGRGDGIIDYNGTGTISGGIFAGAGSRGMYQNFSETSEQISLVRFFDGEQEAGSAVTVTESGENSLFEWTPQNAFSVFMFSSPDLVNGNIYQISVGDSAEEITAENTVNVLGNEIGQGGRLGGNGQGRGMTGENPRGGRPERNLGEEMPEGARPERNPGEEMPEGARPERNPGEEMPEGARPERNPGEEMPEGGRMKRNPGEEVPEESKTEENPEEEIS